MHRQKVSSSSIATVGYDEVRSVLEIKFHTGRVYHYRGVPSDIFEGLMKAKSKGKYYNKYVKDAGFPFKRIK